MTPAVYPATPYLRRLTAANGWRAQLVRDRHGQADVIVAVRIGPVWSDAVAIAGEDRVIAMRYRTNEDALIVPSVLHDESGAIWFREGRAEDVLAELLDELPDPDGVRR